MASRDNIYFVSDLHLGAPNPEESLIREKHFVRWLNHIADSASDLYLLGDIFDFWFEFGRVVPKGYVRLLGKLAELSDDGVNIHIFTGNHDLWYKDYFPTEIGASVYHQPVIREFFGQKYYFAHGDGLGPGDRGYKLMKKVFTAPINKWLYARLHPNFAIWLARFFSSLSDSHNFENSYDKETHLEVGNEFLYEHSRSVLKQDPDLDYFIYGHRHALIDDEFEPGARIFILGDWIQYFSFLKIDEHGPQLDVFLQTETQKV